MFSSKKQKIKLSYTQIIAISFLSIILVGGGLLMLPAASADGYETGPITAFFTATSATCVTGLSVVDTGSYWSLFGKAVILILIQIGGLGFMTIMSALSLLIKRKITLRERSLLMQSAGSISHSGIVRLILRILQSTFLFESAGAVLLAVRFIPKMGFSKGIWNAVFHSVSAFCNAGFDILPKSGSISSLMEYSGDPLVSLTVSALIISGGLGFLVWSDILKCRLHFGKYELHTKIVLISSAVLLFSGTALFFIFEYNASMASFPVGEKILASFFHSVTTRTAGFNSVELSAMSQSSDILTVFLMFIGGSPGSTAGGIKTTTVAVLIMAAITASTRKSSITIFKRRLDATVIRRASATATIYIMVIFISSMIICAADDFSLQSILYETVSAIGTVGLSKGITADLCAFSKIVLMFLMYLGRIGGLSLVLIFSERKKERMTERPTENILIG